METIKSSVYPENWEGQKPLYYVEFNRGDRPGEFTLFKRQFFHSEKELEEMEKKCQSDNEKQWFRISNEVHPWNLFTGEFCEHDGGMPDKNWVKWMVDALNEKVSKE